MRGEQEPKPFIYVPIPGTPPVQECGPNHDRFDQNSLTGKLELQIEVRSEYLFIGSGGYDYQRNVVFYSFMRSRGEIVIPGTSIKGAVRALVEAISNSCVSVTTKEERVPRTGLPCRDMKSLCPACRLFGMTDKESYSGRANFSDGHAQRRVELELVKIGELHQPKPGQGNARKFYAERRFHRPADMRPDRDYRFVEAVKRGSVFKTTLTFSNLTRDELSLLLHALGIPGLHQVKIGGAKPRGFGSVQFAVIQLLMRRDRRDPFAELERKEGEALTEFISEVGRATALVQPDLLQAYQRQMEAEANQPAPRRVY